MSPGGADALTGAVTGGTTGAVGTAAGTTSTSSSATTEDITKAADCATAIRKIDAALEISAEFVGASGQQPTLRQINAVLSILEQSLRQCVPVRSIDPIRERTVGDKRSVAVIDTGLDIEVGIVSDVLSSPIDNDDVTIVRKSDSTERDGIVGNLLGDDSHVDVDADADAAVSGSLEIGTSGNDLDGYTYRDYNGEAKDDAKATVEASVALNTDIQTQVRREVACTECERELFGIVVQLRQIFRGGEGQASESTVVTGIANAISSSTSNGNITSVGNMRIANMIKDQAKAVKNAAGSNSTTMSASQLQRRAAGRMFSRL